MHGITPSLMRTACAGISLCWILFNMVPHVLLLLHTYFGPGYIMNAICKGCMALTAASGVLAIVLMWLLYPREVDWGPALNSSITFMQVRLTPALPAATKHSTGNDSTAAGTADTIAQTCNAASCMCT
jgi:hypothetical protein